MPDITNRIGVDSLDQHILLQNSQDRLDKIFGQLQPSLTDPNSAMSALKQSQLNLSGGYNPNLQTPSGQNQTPVNQELDSQIKEVKAIQLTHQLLQKKDPMYYKGLGEVKYLPYKPIEKYLDEEFGFKPFEGMNLNDQVIQNEDAYASIKNGVFSGIGKFLGRTILGTVAKAGQGLAYLAGLGTGFLNPVVWYNMLANNEDYLTAAGDNIIAKGFEWLDDDLKNDWMPVYQEASSRGKGFWYRLLNDGSFWQNEISDGAAFAISAFVPALAASKLGIGSKAIAALSESKFGSSLFGAENEVLGAADILSTQKSADGFAKASRYMQNAARYANFVDKSAVTVANTFSESYFESRETYDNVFNKLIEQGVPEIIAREKAQNAAKGTFWANIPTLLFSNAFETKLQFQALGMNKIESSVAKGIRQEGAFGKYFIEQPTTKFGKFLESPLGFYAKKLPEAILKEGYWEENIQQAIQRYYQDTNVSKGNIFSQMAGIIKNTAKQTVDATLGDDPETAISIGLGGLMGSGHTIISSAIARQYANDKKFRTEVVSNLNQLQDNWLKYGDPYERDENNNIVLEETTKEDGTKVKQPKVSIPRMAAYALKINELSEKLGMSDDIKNDLLNGFTKKALFSELVVANINAGTIDAFRDNLVRSKSYSDEDLARIGLKKSDDYAQQAEEQIKFIDKIKSLDSSINNDILFKKIKDKKDVDYERMRRSELLRSGVLQLIISDEIDKNNARISQLEGSLNSKHGTGTNDALITGLNSLSSQIKYHEQFVNNPEFDPIDLATANKLLTDLRDQKDKLMEDNIDLLANTKKDKDGVYRYDNEARQRDPESITLAKLQNRNSQLKNSHSILNNEWYKVADTRNGLDYFRSKLQKRDEEGEKELVEEVDKKQAEDQKRAEEVNPLLKYKELQKGDFTKVSNLATKIVFGDKVTSNEDLELQSNYPELLKDLVALYGDKIAEIRKAQLEQRIEFYQGLKDKVLAKVSEAKEKIGNLEKIAQDAIAEYKANDTAKAKAKIRKIVNQANDDIFALEDYIQKAEARIAETDSKIDDLRLELESQPDVRGILKLKENIDKQKSELTTEINTLKGIINKLQKIIKELVQIAKDLFVTFDPLGTKARSTYEENLDKGRQEAIAYEGEILSEAMKLKALKDKVAELERAYADLSKQSTEINNQLEEFKAMFRQFTSGLRDRAITLQRDALKGKPEYTDEERAFNDIFKQEVPPGNVNTIPADFDDYDGEGYMRDLNHVFYTTTDPNYEEGNDRTRAHQEFLNTITQMDSKTLSAKLGRDGKLAVLPISGENINSFNLMGLVDPKYLDTSDIANTGIYMFYVIRRNDGHYFVDKNLDIVDKVGELKDENRSKLVFSSLRAARFRDGEKERYDIKYPKGATEKSLENALIFRKNTIDDTKSINPTNIVSYRFAISRGIQNRAESADSQPVKNPVTSTLISEEDIDPEVISVPTQRTGNESYEVRTVNGIDQKLPVGRPFLLTRNTIHAQYHYLDNNVLTEDQKQTIKQVLHNLASEFSESIDREMTKMNSGTPLERNSPQYLLRLGELAKRRKELGINFINLDYINFLKGILYFRQLDESLAITAANDRQIWLRGDRIFFGNTGNSIDLENPEEFLTSPEVDNFLNGYHHNFNSLQEDKKGRPFTEFYVENNKLERRTWPTYAQYMLSAKLPNGEERTDIPLTTKIKTKEQAIAEKKYNGYFPYIQRGSTLIIGVQEEEKKNKKVVDTTIQSPDAKKSVNLLNNLLNVGKKQQQAQPSPITQPTQAAQSQQAKESIPPPPGSMEIMAKLIAQGEQSRQPVNPITGLPAKTTNIDPTDLDAAADMVNDDNTRRVVTTQGITIEPNLDAAKAEVKRMLPQFSVWIDNIGDLTIGRGIWGQFTGSMIIVARDSEQGTIYHEAFEALVNSILSDKQWNSLYKEFKSRKGSFIDRETGKILEYKDSTEHQAKEELAEEFREFKLTGKIWTGEKQKMGFFKQLLEFIKQFLFNLADIENTFAKLDKGLFAKTPARLTTRFTNSYRLIKSIPEAFYHKFIQGATAVMFDRVFLSDRSFTDFDNNISEDALYNDLRETLRKRYETFLSNSMNMPEGNSLRNSIINAYQIWIDIDRQWPSFIEDHKAFLRPYRIEFIEEDNEDLEGESRDSSNKNRNDYQRNMMEIDAKKTASTSVKLLFGTLVNAKFRNRKGEYFLDANGMPITESEMSSVNQMFLPELVNYDEIVKTAFNNLTGLNNLSRIEKALRQISGIEQVLNAENPKLEIANLDNRQAILVNLYNRVFGNVSSHEEETRWKMRVKFNNYLAKQNPSPELMVVTGKGDAYFIDSNTKETYETLKRKVNQHLKGMQGTYFARIAEGDRVYFKTKSVNIPDLRTAEEFIKTVSNWFNLGDEFSVEFLRSLSDTEYEFIANRLRTAMSAINHNNNSRLIKGLSLDGLGVEGRIKDILNFYVRKTTSGTDSSFLNINGKRQQNYVLNNYMSRILTDLDNSSTEEEFFTENPHLKSTFASDSILLSRMFNQGKRTKEKLALGYMEGTMNSSTRDSQKNSKLGYTDRLLLTFNSNLKGFYYALLPADAETEWGMNLGEFVEYSTNFETSRKNDVLSIFTKYLETEIKVAQEDILSDLQAINSKYENKTRVGDTLRVFRTVLGKDSDLIRTIEKGIEDNVEPAKIIADNKRKISNAIMTYINESARGKMSLFMNQGIIERDGIDYRFNLIYDRFAERLDRKKSKEDGYYFTEDEIMDILRYHTVNYFIANMEMFKMFFGDPAQYKDLSKRLKSFTSGVEWSYYEPSEESGETGLNGFLNTNKNTSEFVNERGEKLSAEIPTKDIFNYRFANSMNLMIVSDLITVDHELYNQLISDQFKDIVKDLRKSADAYQKINEADAQSITDLQTYREIMMKSAWRWTDAHEEQYQFEMAYTRNRLAKKGKYIYGSEELRQIDSQILDKYPTPPAIAAFTPIKPLYAGVSNDERYKMGLLKTSIYPITYRLAEDRELEDLYMNMLNGMNNNRVNIFTFESSYKVGLELDNKNRITSLYDEDKPGNINNFTKKGTPVQSLPFKHFGIQVETQSTGTGNGLGTQLTKDIKLNLFENGVPIDFIDSFSDKSKAIETFYNMSEGERVRNSNFYRLYKEHEFALRDLKSLGYQELLLKIGANEVINPDGTVDYEYKDLTKVRKIILDEMLRRELDENTIDSVELREDLQAFRRAPESMPSYDIMRNILYALVDRSVLSPKVNGKPFIQVASTFFNTNKRKATYFDKESNQWVTLNSEREYTQAVKDGKKILYTSSELRFYKLSQDGKEVEAMEIMLPHIYKAEINEARKAKGKRILSDKEIIDFLEKEQPKLLEGVGFRIPTQATSSVEFFKIKGFLPESFGTAVVVPSAITAKAGSDFDVDKLNTYLNNWVLDKEGLPKYVEFMDDNNSTPQERYNQYIKGRYAEVLGPIRRAIAHFSDKERQNRSSIKKMERDLRLFEELHSDPRKKVEANLISAIMIGIKDIQQAMAKDEELRILTVEGEDLNTILDDARIEYEEAVSKIQSELPFNTFVKLPIYAQNSRAALENRYFQSIRDILSTPYNFQFLLSPNSNENIIENRDAVMDAEGRHAKSKDINHAQYLDFQYMTQQRHYFVRGKSDIGIFAVGMTNYANSQVAGLVVAPITDIRKENEYHLTELNENNFKLPFNYNIVKINGVEYISLSSRFDTELKSVMDKISGYINGAVDVAKDPIIMDMGMQSELASVYLLFERMGVPGKTIALFMKQPIIRDYLHELQLRRSALKNRSTFGTNKEITEYLIRNKYSNGKSYSYEDIKLSNEDLKRMLHKASVAAHRETINSHFTKDENRLQQLILANYLKAKVFADHLLEVVQSSNHDTTRVRSNHILSRKDWQAEDTKKGNAIKSIADARNIVDGATAIKAKTFVGNDVALLGRVEKLYGSKIFTLQRNNPARLVKYLGRKIYYATRYKGVDEFERAMRELEVQILDFMANNSKIVGVESNSPVKSISDRLFLNSYIVNNVLVRNPYNLHGMYQALMEQIKNTQGHALSGNVFLQNLIFENDERAGITTFTLKVKPTETDVYTRNRLTEGMRMLRENESSARFYKALMLGAIIQNGVGYSRNSINNRIPTEDYGEQITKALEGIDSQDFTNFEEILARTKPRS
jgi:hypothetical protein